VSANGIAVDGEGKWRDRSALDLIIALGVVCAGGLLFVTNDAVERLSPAALRWEAAEVDDVLLTLALAVAAAGWFAFRRWRDSVSQLAALREHARERAFYLGRLEELSSQLLQAEQRERDRLAEVLHDEIGQTLYGCQLKLDLLAGSLREPEAQALLAQAAELSASAMAHARDLSFQLSPPALHDLGLAEAIEALLPRLERRYGLSVRLAAGPAWERIPERFRAPVYHSLSELVLNAVKHARASTVSLSAQLEADGGVRVVVADDGHGFDRQQQHASGFGLFSIERRLACMSGSLEIDSAVGRGTTVTLRLMGRAAT
jgi:signal transduction histidine kinase